MKKIMKIFSKENIRPSIVLTLICVIVTVLLVIAYNVTFVDTTGVLTDKLKNGCINIFGDSTYEIKLANDGTNIPLKYKGIKSVIVDKSKGNCLFEIVVDGYTQKGIDVVVGINKNGKVEGISFISIKETPGVGTKVESKSFLDKFKNADANTNIQAIDGISGATYSSKGMKKAVQLALDTYSQNKGEILK